MKKSLYSLGFVLIWSWSMLVTLQSAAAPQKESYVPPESFKEAQSALSSRVGELSMLQNPPMNRQQVENFISTFNQLLEDEAKGKLPENELLIYSHYSDVLGMWQRDPYIELDSDVSKDWMSKVQVVIHSMDTAKKKSMLLHKDLRNPKNPTYKQFLSEVEDWRQKLVIAEKRIAKPTDRSALNQLKQQRKDRIQVLENEIRILEREVPRLERLELRKKREEKKS